MLDIVELFNSYSEEQLIELTKVYINNRNLDFKNTINLYNQGLNIDEKLIRYDENKGKLVYIFGNDIDEIKYYNFSKEKNNEKGKELKLNEVKYIFFTQTNIKIYINKEIDIQKKEAFIKDNTLYLSDFLSENEQILAIINEYANQIFNNINSLGAALLCRKMINYYYANKEIEFSKMISTTIDNNKLAIFFLAYDVFFKILNIFEEKVVRIEDLLRIASSLNLSDINGLCDNYSDEEIKKIKNDIMNNNMPHFPYYCL